MALFNVAHMSMQFSDPPGQKEHDVEALFERAQKRNYRWITGTEAGPGDGGILADLLQDIGPDAGYKIFKPKAATDSWLAVKKNLISGGWKQNYQPVIPGSGKTGSSKRHAPKGLVSAAFNTKKFGRINVGTAHLLTGGRDKGSSSVHGKSDHFEWNDKLIGAIDEWAREVGQGSDLVFYGGDQNIPDSKYDTFRGGVMLSSGDELDKHPMTGHGPIDVIARSRKDGRVKAKYVRSFSDKRFFMYSDHLLLETGYLVEPLETEVDEEPLHHECPDCGALHLIQ